MCLAVCLDRINNYISASPTARPLRGCGRAGSQNDRLSEAVIWNTGMPTPAQCTYRRRCRCRADIDALLHVLGRVLRSHGVGPSPLCGVGLYSYGTYSYGTYSYGTYSYGTYSNGTYSYGTYSYGTYSYGQHRYGLARRSLEHPTRDVRRAHHAVLVPA